MEFEDYRLPEFSPALREKNSASRSDIPSPVILRPGRPGRFPFGGVVFGLVPEGFDNRLRIVRPHFRISQHWKFTICVLEKGCRFALLEER